MKKETINTFDTGLVRDLHPLTTPNNVLTDALNATLVTFNGNENILQNDMGNVEVGTAFLPAGYVPVGMKEYGGIIYVAAWNPELKKGQIGSFPSPKQLWESGDWTVNSAGNQLLTAEFKQSDFYNGDFIHTEIVQKELFSYSDGLAKELHPGDRFCITIKDTINTYLHNCVSTDKLKIQLAVVKEDGTIEVIEDASNNWFFTPFTDNGGATLSEQATNTAVNTIATNNCQVFKGSSSGKLLLIVTIKTLDSFDLTRNYSIINENGNDYIVVTFNGIGTIGNKTLQTNTPNSNLSLYKDGVSGETLVLSQKDATEGVLAYSIYPKLDDQGIIQRFKRSGKINFNKIKQSQDDFHEWRYFVTDDYIKIGWAYEFYNLDESKQIEYIEIAFYDYECPSKYNPGGEGDAPVDKLIITKDYYSGNFEEIIRREDSALCTGRIYIVEFRRKITGENPVIITDKMLYCSTLYNKYYNSLYNNASDLEITEFHGLGTQPAQLDLNTELEYQKSGVTQVKVKNPTNSSFQDVGNITNLNQGYYVTEDSKINDGIEDTTENAHEYITKLTNTYNASITINPSIKVDEGIIGQPKQANIDSIISGFSIDSITSNTNNSWTTTSSNAVFSNTNVSNNTIQITSSGNTVVNNHKLNISGISFSEDRFIQGLSTELQQSTYTIQELAPLYSPTMTAENKRKVFSAYNRESPILVSMRKNCSWYNSTLRGNDVITGSESGAGDDDSGLDASVRRLNETFIPTVSILAGQDGQDASLWVDSKNNNVKRVSRGGWSCGKNEVDGSDNFLAAVWKFSNGYSRMVNLFTPRTWKAQATETWPRLDVMLKCFMSQIFIMQNVSKNGKFITTNSKYYRYQEGDSNLHFNLQSSNISDSLTTNIMYPHDDADNTNIPLTDILAIWQAKSTTAYGAHKLNEVVNLIPRVDITYQSTISLDQTFTEDFGLSDILRYYLGNKLDFTNTNSKSPSVIYRVNTSKNAENKAVCANSNSTGPLPNNDGAFQWNSQPELVECTGGNTQEVMYDWKGGTWTMKVSLKKMFITKGEYEGWTNIPDNEQNELLGRSEYAEGRNTVCKWVENKDHQAPDLYYSVLTSDKSIYSVTTM